MKDWKLTWSYVPVTYHTELGILKNTTQKTVIYNNLNGSKVKLKFTNIGNRDSLSMEEVTITTRNRLTGIAGERKNVTRLGKKKIILQPGEEGCSDEIPLEVKSIENLEISVYFKEQTCIRTVCITWAAQTWQSFFLKGNVTQEEHIFSEDIIKLKNTEVEACKRELSYEEIFPFLADDIHKNRAMAGFCEVAVYTDAKVKTIALFGDSITHMSYYSDPMTLQLYRKYPGRITVINGGIGGNRLLRNAPFLKDMPGQGKLFGTAGIDRIEKDLFEDTTPDLVFCMEGVNDCTHGFAFQEENIPDGEALWKGLAGLIDLVHKKDSKICVSTIMPFGCYEESWRETAEQIRQDFNERIRTENLADMLVDLDAAMRKEEDFHCLKDGMHLGDGVHPNEAGGREIAKIILKEILGENLDF